METLKFTYFMFMHLRIYFGLSSCLVRIEDHALVPYTCSFLLSKYKMMEIKVPGKDEKTCSMRRKNRRCSNPTKTSVTAVSLC